MAIHESKCGLVMSGGGARGAPSISQLYTQLTRQSFPLSPAIRRFALNRLHTHFLTTATVSFLTPRTPYRLPYSHRTLRFAATASHVLCRRPLLLNLFGELRDRLLKLALIAQVDVKQAAELRAHAARPIRRVEAPAVHTVSSHAPFSQTSV